MNSTRSLYETCLSAHTRANKPDRYATVDPNKENYQQLEQIGKKIVNNGQALSERASNYSIIPKRKDSQVSDLKEAIGRIQGYQQTCVKELKLKEAQETKEKVSELKHELVYQQRQEIEENYQSDMKVLTESQVNEMGEFNEFWDERVAEYETEADRVEEEMLGRHQQEVFRVKDELKKMIPMRKKVSTQHLNYKKTMEALLKQKEFIEAERIKLLCEELEKEERNKAYGEKEQRVKFFMGQLDHRHRNELNVLRKRICTGREELLKARVLELEKLLQKFQNVRHQLEKDKNLLISKLDVTQKNLMAGDESPYCSSAKTSQRTFRSARNTLKMRGSSKFNSPNISLISPTNNMAAAEVKQFCHLSPTINEKKHKRSATNAMVDLDVIEFCSTMDSQSMKTTKRSNSVIKQ